MPIAYQVKKLASVLTIFLLMIVASIKAKPAVDTIIKKPIANFKILIPIVKVLALIIDNFALPLKHVPCIHYLI